MVKQASLQMKQVLTRKKNQALLALSELLVENEQELLAQNARDVENARQRGVKDALVDRLALTSPRIRDMGASCRHIMALKDPVGEVFDSFVREDGLRIEKIRVPIGAIGIIYESRPNVTVDATILALKTGNAVLLRGGSDALYSNLALANLVKRSLQQAELPASAVEIIEDPDRELVGEMLRQRGVLDLVIPRGSSSLISRVVEQSQVPVLETGVGVCHIFVDESADLQKSIRVVDNAKTQRPGTCNTLETLLVHAAIAPRFLPALKRALDEKNVELRGCPRTLDILDIAPATEQDWDTEYLDLVLSIRIVDSVDEAIDHVQRHSTSHSDSILSENYRNIQLFLQRVDSAAVYVNASTRFTDGGEFGFGAEMGISTQRLHARGPVGLRELTTYKYLVHGDYHVR